MLERNCLVYALHGTVSGFDARLFVHLNLMAPETFVRHLVTRPSPYVDLSTALRGGGDALTIDDATHAAFEAAMVARENGHAVTLFVNPLNVEHGVPYFFARLNVILDSNRRAEVEYIGVRYPLGTRDELMRLRRGVKKTLCSLATEDERQSHITAVARLLEVEEPPLPEHLRTLSLRELRDLMAAGVRVENHGWTHCHPFALDDARYAAELEQARQWLADRCNMTSSCYAVPFGRTLPRRRSEDLYGTYLLLDGSLFEGRVGPRIVNRASLNL